MSIPPTDISRPRPGPARFLAERFKKRRGLTLVEAALVLAVVALVFGGFAQLLLQSSENMRARNAADRLREVAKAAELYVNAYASEILSQNLAAASVDAIPISGTAGTKTVQGRGFLPLGFQDRNSYGHSHVLLVRRVDPAPSAPATEKPRLEAMVTTVPPTTAAGARIPDRMLGRIAQMVGAQGGFRRAEPFPLPVGDVVLGVGGGWRVDPANWNAGGGVPAGTVQAALAVNNAGMLSDYLNRNDIGVPEANTMRTTMLAAPGKNAAGLDKYAVESADANIPLKIGPNVTVPNSLDVGKCGSTNLEGDITACNDVRAKRLVDVDNGVFRLDPAGGTLGDTVLNVDGIRLRGGATADDPRFGGNGMALRDLLPRYVAKEGYVATNVALAAGESDLIPKPSCGTGSPRIVLTPMQDSNSIDMQVAKLSMPNYLYTNSSNPTAPAVTSVTCTAGGCDAPRDYFVTRDNVGRMPALADVTVAGQFYRQYVAQDATCGGTSCWRVSLRGTPAANTAAGPVPWRALAQTFCYF